MKKKLNKHKQGWIGFFLFQLCFVFTSHTQSFLKDTCIFEGTSCILNSVYEVDSGYYVVGNRLDYGHGQNGEFLLGFIDHEGGNSIKYINYDPFNSQDIHGGVNSLLLNERNNFVYYYQNCDTSNCYPRIKEISPQGVLVADLKLDVFMDSLDLRLWGYNDMIQLRDSTYILTINSEVLSNPNLKINILLHLDKDFQFINYFKFYPQGTWRHTYAQCFELQNGNIVYRIADLNDATAGAVNFAGRIRFMELTRSGVVIKDLYYQDSQTTSMPMGFCVSQVNTGYFSSYFNGIWDDHYGWFYDLVLVKTNVNFQPIWKKVVQHRFTNSISQYAFYPEIKPTSDGNYVIAGTSFSDTTGVVNEGVFTTTLLKFDESGNDIWKRNVYYKPFDATWEVLPPFFTSIKDLIQTSDGGFCMVGEFFDRVGQFAGKWFQKGYFLKTNCLGFMDVAHAAMNYKAKNNFEVQFYNRSMQAGSYTWHFGDGTILTTDEYTDTLIHTYPHLGTYEGMLIAHGCNGDNDTLRFTINAQLHEDPSVVTDGNGFFSVFPNPVSAGGDLYVYLNDLQPENGEVVLSIFDINGRQVQQIGLDNQEGTYFIKNELASGLYMVQLSQGGKRLQEQKLLVYGT